MGLKFAHIADCHLGGWRQEELQTLNFLSFQKAISTIIQEKPEFLLVAGDLFDSAYPPIEILKETFAEFKKLKEANIPVFIVAGSHDFSASGKTFLDVLEKAGFCTNIEKTEIDSEGKIKLSPEFFGKIAIYGYSGRKSGLEVEDLKKIYFNGIHPFSIFMFHSTIKDVVGDLPMESVEKETLPLANYYAMGHIHKRFESRIGEAVYVYPGPIYPNNFQELTDLKYGSFHMVEVDGSKIKTKSILLPIKEVVSIEIDLVDGLTATEKIISEIDRLNLSDKVFLMKLKGVLLKGKSGDIRFNEIEDFVKKKGAYVFLRNISALTVQEADLEIGTEHVENIEEKIIKEYSTKNPADYNLHLNSLMHALSIDKNEDEKETIYEKRLLDEVKKILSIQEVIS
ncbi:DNA double-strand break repair protein Mre11 [uncultured archaeon]|nr:DNA double-strand break repair protein Mre11 [uncultured archaeon]